MVLIVGRHYERPTHALGTYSVITLTLHPHGCRPYLQWLGLESMLYPREGLTPLLKRRRLPLRAWCAYRDGT